MIPSDGDNISIISYDKEDRVMIFIDLRNMTKSIGTDIKFSRLDFVRMATYLRGPRKLVAAYIFDSKGVLEAEDKSKRFHDYLRHMGFRVIARNSYDTAKDEQKEVDVAMAVQMVVHALKDNYDVAIVVSGDRDFLPAVQEIQAAGKKVEVAAFDTSLSSDLSLEADNIHKLETLPLLTLFNPVEDIAMTDGE